MIANGCEVAGQVARGAEAVFRGLGQAALDDPAQESRGLRDEIPELLWLLVQDRCKRVHAGIFLKCPLARN
jgi:hypothetical protein